MEIVDSLIALIMFWVNNHGSKLHIKHICHHALFCPRLKLISKIHFIQELKINDINSKIFTIS